jgi:hypothetical protein
LSSIPALQLRDVLIRNANPNNAQDWMNIVAIYIDARRYVEAREMLVLAIQKFPELEKNRAQLKELDQKLAEQMFEACKVAQDTAGQYSLARQMLESFTATTVSLETRVAIDQKLKELDDNNAQCQTILRWLREDITAVQDPSIEQELQPILAEIQQYLNADTITRFADYKNQRSDETLKKDNRLALGLGGWLYGQGLAEKNLSLVRSGYVARRLIQEYLSFPQRRDQWINDIQKLESGSPKFVARILENMAPPIETGEDSLVTMQLPDPVNAGQFTPHQVPGRYLLQARLNGPMRDRTVRYLVQLPPEYNPYRKYPCILALPGEELPFDQSLDFWVSLDRSNPSMQCYGEATRNGFIVVSPEWNEPKQPMYNYTEN